MATCWGGGIALGTATKRGEQGLGHPCSSASADVQSWRRPCEHTHLEDEVPRVASLVLALLVARSCRISSLTDLALLLLQSLLPLDLLRLGDLRQEPAHPRTVSCARRVLDPHMSTTTHHLMLANSAILSARSAQTCTLARVSTTRPNKVAKRA